MHQVDKGGQPYIGHLERVVDRLLCRWPDATKAQVQIALLHDVIEDGQIGGTKLASVADDHVMVTIHLMTNPKTMSYLDYIRTIADSGNLDAIRVKLADNEDNSDPSRAHPLHAEMLERKYRPAKVLLEQSLRKLETDDERPETDGSPKRACFLSVITMSAAGFLLVVWTAISSGSHLAAVVQFGPFTTEARCEAAGWKLARSPASTGTSFQYVCVQQ